MTPNFQWTRSTAFFERVDRLELHGLHFQHLNLCERRAWMYLHRINFAQWNPRVATGLARQASHYQRDHSTVGLFGLAPDRLDWEARIVFEHKGSAGAPVAVGRQVAFYAVMLSIATGWTWSGRISILANRRWRDVRLDTDMLESLWGDSERLEVLIEQEKVPMAARIGLCDACSLATFCGFD